MLKRVSLIRLSLLIAATMLALTVIKGNVHYSIFTTAAQQLFVLRENPYNRPLDPTIFWQTLWLYSPSGALFFLPFSFLPNFLGIFLYVGGSFALVISGIDKYCKTYLEGFLVPGILSLLLLSETLGAIQATKFELFTCGLLLWIFYWFAVGKEKTAALILGILGSIKFQTLPVSGLLTIFFLRKRKFSVLIFLWISFFLSLAWPWLIWPLEFVRTFHSDWLTTLTTSSATNWSGGQNLPVFLMLLLNLKMDYSDFSRVSFLYAAFCAVLVGFSPGEPRALYNLCLCLGVSFTVLFSPLSQSSSYVLTTPLVLTLYFLYRKQNKILLPLLGIYWFTTSLVYSDLVPKTARQFAYVHNLKPVGTLCLVVFLCAALMKPKKQASFYNFEADIDK